MSGRSMPSFPFQGRRDVVDLVSVFGGGWRCWTFGSFCEMSYILLFSLLYLAGYISTLRSNSLETLNTYMFANSANNNPGKVFVELQHKRLHHHMEAKFPTRDCDPKNICNSTLMTSGWAVEIFRSIAMTMLIKSWSCKILSLSKRVDICASSRGMERRGRSV